MTTKQVQNDQPEEVLSPPGTCLFCGKELTDKRTKFCKGKGKRCKQRYKKGEVPSDAQQSSWSIQSANADVQPLPPAPTLEEEEIESDSSSKQKKTKGKGKKKSSKKSKESKTKQSDTNHSDTPPSEDQDNGSLSEQSFPKSWDPIDGGNVVSLSDMESQYKQEMGLPPDAAFPQYDPQPSLSEKSTHYPSVPYIGPSSDVTNYPHDYDPYEPSAYDPDEEFIDDDNYDDYGDADYGEKEDDYEQEGEVGQAIGYQDKAALTYEEYRKDPMIFTPGETWIETFIFDGDFSLEFDANFNSSKWVPALERIWDSLPVERLIGALQYEYGGGAFLIQFMRTGLKGPRKVKPPIILRIKEDPMRPTRGREEQREAERARIIDLERRKAEEARLAAIDQRRLHFERERDATSRMFDMQEKILEQQNQKEASLMDEIRGLREREDKSPEVVRVLEDQLAALRQERHNLELKQDELRRIVEDKDNRLFQMILEERKEAERERHEERRKQEETQTTMTQIMADRDTKFASLIAELRESRENGGGESNLLEILMTINHQNSKAEEMRNIQMAEERRRQEKADELKMMQMAEERRRHEEAQLQHSRDMMLLMQTFMKNSEDGSKSSNVEQFEKMQERFERQLEQSRQDSLRMQEKFLELKIQPPPATSSSVEDKFEKLLMHQNELTRQELMEARRESKDWMNKLFDNKSQNKDVGSMQAFLESANVFKKAKEAVTEVFDLATDVPEPVDAGAIVPENNPIEKYMEKAADMARAFNVGAIFDAIGQRVAGGGKEDGGPSSLRPPSIPPPAGIYQPAGFPTPSVSAMPPIAPPTIDATSQPQPHVPPQPQPQVSPQSQPQGQPQYVPYEPSHTTPGQQIPQADLSGQQAQEQITAYGAMLVQLVESAISGNITPEDFVGQLPVENLSPLSEEEMSKEDLVASIFQITNSPIVKSLRGRKWIESAYDVIQTKLKAVAD